MARLVWQWGGLLLATALSVPLPAWATDLSTVPLPTYSTGSSVAVKPNILMVLDDSGSMDWNYLPDWANDVPPNYSSLPDYLSKNASFNGVAYNPAIRYLPPIGFNADGTKNTAAFPSMDGQTAGTGADSTAKPNWKAVKNDGYGIQSTGTSNLVDNANSYFFTTLPGEYCNASGMTGCTTTSTGTGNYLYPANLRWCDSSALTNCRALQDSTFRYPRMPAPRVATMSFSGSNNAVVTGITIDGLQIMSGSTSTANDSTDVATRVRDKINACANAQAGNCTTVGYTAIRDGDSVVIFAPGATNPGTPVASKTGTVTISGGAFAQVRIPASPYLRSTFTASSGVVPGENLRTAISSSVTSYPYPGSNAKAAGRSDCAGTTCTYAEEMTNYANWWAYYRTRMQMMKTSTSRAFSTLDTDADIAAGKTSYRVGYLSINNNTGSDFANITDFDAAQKVTWFSKLFAANPNNSTPLRAALSTAGRLYAGKYNGLTLNGTRVTDPLQFSCQKNFTILSTDGFWNTGAGFKLDGTTAVGNQDGLLPRPYTDGASAQNQSRTSQLQQRTNLQQAQRGTLQKQTSQLQKMTSQLQMKTSQAQSRTALWQTRTSSNSGSSWTSWTPASAPYLSSCVPDSKSKDRRECQIVGYTSWANAASCNAGTNNGVLTECQPLVIDWSNASSCTSGTTSSGLTTYCQYVRSGWSNAGSCTALAESASSPYSVGLAASCQTAVTSTINSAAACSVTTPDANGVSTQCDYVFAAAATLPGACAPVYTSGDYTNATVYKPCTYSAGNWSNVASCTATTVADASGNTTSCQYAAWTSWSNVSSCTAAAQSAGPAYTVAVARQCQGTSTGGTFDTLADVAAYYNATDLRSPTATGADATGVDSSGGCTGPTIAPATTPNNLCTDNVAAYGRDTNTAQHMTTHTLGLGAQGMMVFSPYQNNLAGQRVYVPDYWNQVTGDFYSVFSGATPNPGSGICSWMMSGKCTWPTPASDSSANIDDLWHAAVNGRGSYFSATDPQSLAESLKSVLHEIAAVPLPGTAAAAASSNPNVTSSDNFVFSSSYRSVDWFGELIMQELSASGTLSDSKWSAMRLLDCATSPWQAARTYAPGDTYSQGGTCYLVNATYTSGGSFASGSGADGQGASVLTGTPVTRTIYTVGASGLVPFTWNSLSATQQGYFSTPYISYVSATQGLTQFCSVGPTCLGSTAQTSAEGQALVDFLRGDRTNEGGYFRSRKHVLGDIVSSEARYVKKPLQSYSDTNYLAFKAAKADRAATVYVGSNDGMLHAFDALTGNENWAFIPAAVLPNLYRLADSNYSTKHRFYVDGTPEVGDICPNAPGATCSASQWTTIIVGGLNSGGKAFYALDITDPAHPRYLWEFTNAGLGYSYSNPRITKLRDGTWVVIVASGYNNTDGIGRLFVINASTGTLIRTIDTAAGSSATPSGLARIAARAPTSATNNTVEEVYGGDVLGNVWRFDVNDTIGAAGFDAQLLVTLLDASGNPQPITAKPTVATVGNFPLVLVGTGRYLGLSDISDTSSQTMYGIQDKLDTTTLPNPRSSGSNFVQQTLTAGTCPADAPASLCSQAQNIRAATSNAVDWSVKNGWYVDYVTGGERSFSDATLSLGTLVFTTVIPQTSTDDILACSEDQSSSAKSYLYYLDYLTGGAVAGTKDVGGEQICACVSTRPSVVKAPDGSVQSLTRMSGGASGIGTDMGTTRRDFLPVNLGGPGTVRRISWRELNGD